MLSAKKIASGKTGQIEVRIKTANLFGTLEKPVHVTTNDPRNPEVTLTLKAVVEPEIALSEHGIFFGNVPKGKEARKEILLTLRSQKAIRILGAETTDARISVDVVPVAGSRPQQWKLTAVRKADAKPGDHFGEIVVKTDSSLTPRISIYERGTVSVSGK